MTTSSLFKQLTPYFLFLLLIATIGPLLFGYHLAELNAPSQVITCERKSINLNTPSFDQSLPQCIPMNATQFGLVSSFFTLGGLIGALAAGPIIARAGPVRTMLYASICATIGPIFEALAPNVGTMALGRLIAGLGAGSAMVVVPIYIFDIAPPDHRGLFGSFTQVQVNVGVSITQVLGYFLSRGQLWRIILAVGGAIGLAQALGLLFAGQNSPKWMAHNGKQTQARRVLRKIRGREADIDDEIAAWGETNRDGEDEEVMLLPNEDRVHNESADAQHPPSAAAPRENQTTSGESLGAFAVLRHPDTRQAVLAITVVMIAQQFTGINSIIMYGVSLLSDLLSANSALLNVCVSLLNVVITACAAPLVDKLGRKTCLLISIGGMGTNSVLLAIGIMRSLPILSGIAVVLFVSSFGLGLGPVPFILPSEFVDASAVGATQSWALAANWIATFCVAQFFPMLNEMMGKGQVYFIFAAMALIFGSFVAWYVPESQGKEDADEVWGRKKGRARVE